MTGFVRDAGGVTPHHAGGTQRGTALVGADGLHSVVRRQVLGETPADDTGDAVWRVMLPMGALPPDDRLREVAIRVGPRRHAVAYPLRGGAILSFVGCVEAPGWQSESWTETRPWAGMAADFAGWHPLNRAIGNVAPRGGVASWARACARPWRAGPRGARIPRTTRIVTGSAANRLLSHNPDRDALRDAFARRDMDAERTASLFSSDPAKAPLAA